MKVNIELTNGKIKEYEFTNYPELLKKLKDEGITESMIKKVTQQ